MLFSDWKFPRDFCLSRRNRRERVCDCTEGWCPVFAEDVPRHAYCQGPHYRAAVEVLDRCQVIGGKLHRTYGHSKGEKPKKRTPIVW
jgi:hypothetical protein